MGQDFPRGVLVRSLQLNLKEEKGEEKKVIFYDVPVK
jgi:hypothetical protein